MPTPNHAALEFLLTRRSRPAKTLTGPAPDRDALQPILTAAARTPDHGKLEPWRFIVLEGPALTRIADAAETFGSAQGRDADAIRKARSQFADSPLCVAVIESPKESPKVPVLEQTYSAGAACLALLNAALASGWGANWLTGWLSEDRAFVEGELGLLPHERVVGFVHIGTETSAPPERPRPDLDAIVSWVSE
ncbi:MAG: nitroreductase [Rhodobacteraceae bacterium]|jgi:nitroreductase|uniref:Putative NAD(P)H nitroreductase n=1 Tax=Salipiger profundus TaxID=1229727 RepID=A0A1U7D3Y7_9RHOB|nr:MULTISPECIES: nitroreductase [Salipiger]APX22871.1 nitroreductase [Salipiger profundus]MAB05727.1 nitroreductase [Paracoccaceae bacterium]GGA09065.1 nitroreductase [Salipiger profundus]SFC57842.1 Nitroreductase [Salipiger profundus]